MKQIFSNSKIFTKGYFYALLVILVVLVAYGQTLLMYFWHDDYTIYYLFQQGKLLDYPYQMNSVLGNAAISLFGFNARAYFVLAIILFFLAALAFGSFIFLVTKDRVVSTLGAAIFASGYVGQVTMEMFIGNGIIILPAMSLFFICLSALIKYINLQKTRWLLLSLFAFGLTLEIAPHRYAAFIVVILGILGLFISKARIRKFLFLAAVFGILFYLELFVHPTKFILGYKAGTMGNFSPFLLAAINGRNILNLFGSFWNAIFPSFYQRLLFINRTPDFYDKLSVALGLLVFLFIVFRIFQKTLKYEKAIKIMLVPIFGSLLTFFISIPDVVLESEHRYLMTISYAAAIVPLSLVGKNGKKAVALLAGFVIILLHLSAGIITQREFVNDYSRHARNIFTDLKNHLPSVNRPKIIYIEGSTKMLNYAVGDALRVGAYSSEVAVAVHYETAMENIILPESLGQIKETLLKNNRLTPDDVYTFIYDGSGLKDTSAVTRRLIKSPPSPINIPANGWQAGANGYETMPGFKIDSLAPLLLHISVDMWGKSPSTKVDGEKIVIRWQYNTSGDIRQKMEKEVTLGRGRNLIEIEIPAGGEYLDKIRLDFDRSKLNTRINYAKISYKE